MTILPNAVLESPLIFNIRSDRHIKDIGTTSGGLAVGGNGQVLQWNCKWEAADSPAYTHKYSAKATVGILQGNAVTLGYKFRFPKHPRLEDYITIPKSFSCSAVLGRFPKIEAMLTQELTSLATHPTLSFGMEHDITLGCWTWIWEWSYQNSKFRMPIPVIYLGSITDPSAYYVRKLYHGVYWILVQSMLADILQDEEPTIPDRIINVSSESKFLP